MSQPINWALVPLATHFLAKADDSGMYLDTFWRYEPHLQVPVAAWQVLETGEVNLCPPPLVCVMRDRLVSRPAQEWDGEGIPPVGTVCEALATRTQTYRKCEVVAVRDGMAIVVFCDHEELQWAKHFKPLRTAQQRADGGEPEPVQWNGKGLPPVGIECEVKRELDPHWQRVTILVHFLAAKQVAVYVPVEGNKVVAQAIADCFRPILTGRQRDMIAARDIVVRDMLRVIEQSGASDTRADDCLALYDAGFGQKVTV
ncbi:hypothetical protein [Pseudomonas sp.]|jgi:hypothetical protein|uniref:hypothetical protein n=1 Tax=Pseudomonas sp. TaxID=306 RepID=UPI002EDB1B6E